MVKGTFLGRKRIFLARFISNNWDQIVDQRSELINRSVMRYAQKEAKITGLPLKTVLKSRPIRNYARKVWLK